MNEENSKPTIIVQEYSSAFIIDKAKLSRILNILEEKFNDLKLQFLPEFKVELSRGEKLKLTSLEDIFKLDNTIRNPIKTLKVGVSSIDPEIPVYLDCSIFFISSKDDFRHNISLSVRSFDSKVTLQTFAALEEQIQRTFLESLFYKIRISKYTDTGIVLAFSLGGATIFTALLSITPGQLINDPPFNELNQLLIQANNAKSSEEKINFLFEVTKEEIKQKLPRESNFNLLSLFNTRNFFIILPIIIILGCAFYAVKYCYPIGVFLWGDYEVHYNRLIAQRNLLWTVVVLSILLGVITNLFVIGLSGFINLSS